MERYFTPIPSSAGSNRLRTASTALTPAFPNTSDDTINISSSSGPIHYHSSTKVVFLSTKNLQQVPLRRFGFTRALTPSQPYRKRKRDSPSSSRPKKKLKQPTVQTCWDQALAKGIAHIPATPNGKGKAPIQASGSRTSRNNGTDYPQLQASASRSSQKKDGLTQSQLPWLQVKQVRNRPEMQAPPSKTRKTPTKAKTRKPLVPAEHRKAWRAYVKEHQNPDEVITIKEEEEEYFNVKRSQIIFGLNADELRCLPHNSAPNPLNEEEYAPMRLYRWKDLTRLACKKEAVLNGIVGIGEDGETDLLVKGQELFEKQNGLFETLPERKNREYAEKQDEKRRDKLRQTEST
ncbi:hypothetical protein P280DRAFT_470259 [Massarina eburnea CBS 473.64]|uniref:Uncharacterized protein n=1 Tax=Massarina eburnea CBS 473.64 TaxID=1395130 RepID=A0A6A6RXY7_9PLEO|nr:hypothetical protein P280DRAFT_470259 [Massarina eburnea CBS 473.64]